MTSTQKPAADLVAQAIAQGETRSKVAAQPLKKALGYGAFQMRATGAYALLTYTPQGKEADWTLVAADKGTILARGKRMKDVIATHDAMVAQGKIKKLAEPIA